MNRAPLLPGLWGGLSRLQGEMDRLFEHWVGESRTLPPAYPPVNVWEDEEALQRHFATSHIAEFMRAISATIVGPPEVKFHTIASSRDLSDVSAAG